jgi:hypothetical protein
MRHNDTTKEKAEEAYFNDITTPRLLRAETATI